MVEWIMGLLTGLAVYKLATLIKNKQILLKWYHYLVGVIWYLGLTFVVLFVTTSIYEKSPQVVSMFLLIFGGAFLIFTIAIYRLLFSKQQIVLGYTEKQSV